MWKEKMLIYGLRSDPIDSGWDEVEAIFLPLKFSLLLIIGIRSDG